MGVTEFEEFRQRVKDRGFEEALRIYYSVYRAIVLDNADPEERGRVVLTCPSVGHDQKKGLKDRWVDPVVDVCGPAAGWFCPPLVGAVVRVMFDNGNPGEPKLYFGGWYTKSDKKFPVPAEFAYVDGKPQKRGFRSRVGHALVFNDAPGSEAVTLQWRQIPKGHAAQTDPDAVVTTSPQAGEKFAQIQLTAAGITIVDANGTNVFINSADKELTIQNAGGQIFSMVGKTLNLSDGASPASTLSLTGDGEIHMTASKGIVLNTPNVSLKSGGVTLADGKFSPVIADVLLPWLASHIHATTAPGAPTGPAAASPTGPPPDAAKAQSVKIK